MRPCIDSVPPAARPGTNGGRGGGPAVWALLAGLATAVGLLAGAAQAQAGGAARIRALTGTAYETTALAVEEQLHERVNAPLRAEFHRAQAFRIEPRGTRLVSLAWWKEAGGETHCVLGLRDSSTLQVFDALLGEADAPPWSCEGAPALRASDLDADGCPEVLAQYEMRPPSGEVFAWGLVLACDAARGTYRFDAERSARWRAALVAAKPVRTLRQAEALLRQPAAPR